MEGRKQSGHVRLSSPHLLTLPQYLSVFTLPSLHTPSNLSKFTLPSTHTPSNLSEFLKTIKPSWSSWGLDGSWCKSQHDPYS